VSEAEFDSVAATYRSQHAASIRMSGEEPEYFARYKADDAGVIAQKAGLVPRRILDFGSGVGNSIAPLCDVFADAQLTCLDVSEESLALARRENGEIAAYRTYDGTQIPDDIGQFDIVFTACVFHHIPEGAHIELLRQIKSHLEPGGRFILFEHNPWNPVTRKAVADCPFDEHAVLISGTEMKNRLTQAGFQHINLRFRLFFPAVLSWLRPLESYLAWLPLGAQYCLSAE
jgi:SAM-dependent methyltransferase